MLAIGGSVTALGAAGDSCNFLTGMLLFVAVACPGEGASGVSGGNTFDSLGGGAGL